MTTKRLHQVTWLGMLTALCVVGRLLIHPWPNVQPVSAILLYAGTVLPFFDVTVVTILSLVVTSLFFGFGTWTIAQIMAYLVIVWLFRIVSRYLPKKARFLFQVALACLMGYVYGFVISFVQATLFGIPHFWVYYGQGLLFDTYHAVGNFLFYLIIIPPLNRVWQRFYPKKERRGGE